MRYDETTPPVFTLTAGPVDAYPEVLRALGLLDGFFGDRHEGGKGSHARRRMLQSTSSTIGSQKRFWKSTT